MGQGTASIPDNLLDDVVTAAEDCPGECIFIEVE
jgi:ferredoxin